MSRLLDELRDWGCDVAGAMERMSDDEGFYLDCLREVAADPYFERLREALDEGDERLAFNAAHTLKGVLATVGLTPMYQKIVEIVEPLRGGGPVALDGAYGELMAQRRRLNRILDGVVSPEKEEQK